MTEQQMPQITGKQIRDLRRNLGMTHLRFAQGLNVPVWLVEILEQECADAPHELEQPIQLAQLVPESVRNDFYQRLLKVYGLPEEWENARVAASGPEADSSDRELTGDLDETTLFIPVTVSVQMTMEWLDVLLRKYEALLQCKAGTKLLTVEETKAKIASLKYIQDELAGIHHE